MRRLRCPECDQIVKIDEEDERATVRCPSCGHKFRRDGRAPRGQQRSSAMPWVLGGLLGGGVLVGLVVVLLVLLRSSGGGDEGAPMDPELAKLVADVASRDHGVAQNAARELATKRPNEHRGVVARKLAELTDTPEPFTRKSVVQALAVWATPNEVPALIKALDDHDIFTRQAACDGLARLPDERAAAPLVRCLLSVHTRSSAEKALRALGPMAEKELIPVLQGGADVFATQRAVRLLKDIGTQQCVPALQALVANDNIHIRVHVRGHAQEALATITNRTKT